jgi:hypothetical protein
VLGQLCNSARPGIFGRIRAGTPPPFLLQLARVATIQPRAGEGPARADQGGDDAKGERNRSRLVLPMDSLPTAAKVQVKPP